MLQDRAEQAERRVRELERLLADAEDRGDALEGLKNLALERLSDMTESKDIALDQICVLHEIAEAQAPTVKQFPAVVGEVISLRRTVDTQDRQLETATEWIMNGQISNPEAAA